MKQILVTALLLYCQLLLSQCDGNLLKNGSFELDTVRRSQKAKLWDFFYGSPDIENANDDFSDTGLPWLQNPISSSDGGNWYNFGYFTSGGLLESVGQTVNLGSSLPHKLSFEYTAQVVGQQNGFIGHASIDVLINGSLVYTTPIDSTVFTWERASFMFTPAVKENLIQFQINPDIQIVEMKYVAIDGVCLEPVKTGMFCDN